VNRNVKTSIFVTLNNYFPLLSHNVWVNFVVLKTKKHDLSRSFVSSGFYFETGSSFIGDVLCVTSWCCARLRPVSNNTLTLTQTERGSAGGLLSVITAVISPISAWWRCVRRARARARPLRGARRSGGGSWCRTPRIAWRRSWASASLRTAVRTDVGSAITHTTRPHMSHCPAGVNLTSCTWWSSTASHDQSDVRRRIGQDLKQFFWILHLAILQIYKYQVKLMVSQVRNLITEKLNYHLVTDTTTTQMFPLTFRKWCCCCWCFLNLWNSALFWTAAHLHLKGHTQNCVFAHTQKAANLTIYNKWSEGILSLNFTDTFWGHQRFKLHLMKRRRNMSPLK